jgi:hypothetical protein
MKILGVSMKIDMYSYRSAHMRVCCSSGALHRGCGAEMCNTHAAYVVKRLCTLLKYEEFFTAFTS